MGHSDCVLKLNMTSHEKETIELLSQRSHMESEDFIHMLIFESGIMQAFSSGGNFKEMRV